MTKRKRVSRGRLWALLVVGSIAMFQLQLVLAVTADAATFCNGAFSGDPAGDLRISATRGGAPLLDGDGVSPGDHIELKTEWTISDWNSLSKVSNCFQLAGADVDSLDYQEKPTDNDGVFVYPGGFNVPADATAGQKLCVRADLAGQPSGAGTSTYKSNRLCWTVGGGTTPKPDVKITKTASKSTVDPGEAFSFTLTATNTTSVTAKNVVISDTVPDRFTVGAVTGPNCSKSGPNNQTITCDVGDLAGGASQVVTINVTATAGACATIDNTATVTATDDSNAANNSDKATVAITCTTPKPDVEIKKATSKGTVAGGESFSFTLTAKNVSTVTATNVVIKDTVPSRFTVNTVDGAGCSFSGQSVTCDPVTLAPGATKVVTINVTTTAGACETIDNTATVTATDDSNAANNSDKATVIVTCNLPDLKIEKSSGAPTTGVAPGEAFTYTLKVGNIGGATATGVKVQDTVPAGLSITQHPSNCTVSGRDITCTLGDIAAGANASVTFTVEASTDACPMVTNRATVTASNAEGNTNNNTSNDVTTPVNCEPPPPEQGIALRIVKTNDADRDGDYSDNEEARRPDVDVPFLLAITNTGEVAVKITDLTDAFDNSTIDLLDAKCSELKGLTLQPGESATCNFTLNNYSPPHGSPLTNTAEVCGIEMDGTRTDCDQNPSTVRSAEVLGQTVTPTKTPPGGVAYTGSNGSLGFGAIALTLLLLGSGFMWAGYRRRERYEG